MGDNLSTKSFKHGTRNGYEYHHCHCEKCMKANKDYMEKWKSDHPERNAEYHRKNYFLNKEECDAESTKYRHDAQRETLDSAHHYGQQWTVPELEIASRTYLTSREVAVMLGRTIYAVGRMRQKLKKKGEVT